MNQYRFLVDDVKKKLTDLDKQQSMRDIKLSQEELTAFSNDLICFLKTKAILAAESAAFYLKQQYDFHQNGYPSTDIDYLFLLDTQLDNIEKVFSALFRIHRGFLYAIYDEYPEVLAWVCLGKRMEEQDTSTTLLGISILDNIDSSLSMALLLRSNSMQGYKLLAFLVEGQSCNRDVYFSCLVIKQRISTSLVKYWLKEKKLPEKKLHYYLALMNVNSSIEWLNSLNYVEECVFEQLILKSDRGRWLRRQCINLPNVSEHMKMYLNIITPPNTSEFTIGSEYDVIHFILSGDTELTPIVIDHLKTLDEVDGQRWCEALFTVYGESLPILPSQLGFSIDWEDVLIRLLEWIKSSDWKRAYKLRMGNHLNFHSTILAMKSSGIPSNIREWLWRELCIVCRVHFYWDCQLSHQDQKYLFDCISTMPLAKERFDLRGKSEIMGY